MVRKCIGREGPKIDATVLMCVNMTGTERILFVIGKLHNPHCSEMYSNMQLIKRHG
jgi:hypothetical protein